MARFLFGGGEDAGEHGVVVGEGSGVDVAQGDDDGSGERGGVDQMRAAETLRVGDGVVQDEAARRRYSALRWFCRKGTSRYRRGAGRGR